MRAMDLVGLSSARGSIFDQSEESICLPIRAEYMLTNQSEGARYSTNQSTVSDDQSQPSSRHATRGTSDGIKGTVPSFLPFPSVTQYQQHINLRRNLVELI